MAKSTNTQPIDLSSVESTTLQEFCIVLSNSDRRVELIAGFNHEETAQGRIKDTAANFKARFDAFVNKPA